ncbi:MULTISPECIES: Druantia anti-phage system protein DruA [Ralstonia solanacearum species complex]|uniref:Druantia anti-phage system protein DruA n=1 Tax=Ralstonia solanacearum species complex TaxID=3116862 RepID=UPI000E5685D8|nr:Druantia anti-phage system protein DruA [Ralstonia solanacearum]AXV76131.1 hypothetical protein CJO76_03640 [Ralstonia solanacearum]AXV90139.1 hypothetical protein CJO79_03630 [Ralstonia solanacearum]AXW75049.1 hypothetical protein CJO97_03640 [Ralstonia solanacearum]BEU71156.1 hypothetical protein MAFF211271_07110 [Ralstonia pseudosolanacearum]
MTSNVRRTPSDLIEGAFHPPSGAVIWLESRKQQLAADIVSAHAACTNALTFGNKDFVRGLHVAARGLGERIGYGGRLAALFERHRHWFKNGQSIDVHAIKPALRLVQTTEEEQLWTLARACWSMPYSKGYGRRLRFLVVDETHGGLIGILGLQSPPADLACRDTLFEFPAGRKLELVNQTMDAYTIGAIPPYSFLLGGKLCAGLLAADAIREAYWLRYAAKRTTMQRQQIQQPLVAITTTSAFGKSAQYNRLRYGSRLLAEPIGYTKGFGMLHLEHLYDRMCDLLVAHGQLTPNGYGNGPKVRWQNVTKALMLLGLPLDLLAHGVQREVYLFSLVSELHSGMAGGSFGAPQRLSVDEYSEYWKQRWAAPRSNRYPEWREVDAQNLVREKVQEWDLLTAQKNQR